MTQEQKIIAWMFRNKNNKDWWYAPDFMQQGMPSEFFVGYEASAVISRLTKDFPTLFKVDKRGKYRYIAINWQMKQYFKTSVKPRIWDLIEYNWRIAEGKLAQR